MTDDPSKFVKFTRFNDGSVSFGGNTKRKIIGKGIVEIGNLTIKDVSLVKSQSLNYNLISINQLCHAGYKICFQGDKCSGTSKDLK